MVSRTENRDTSNPAEAGHSEAPRMSSAGEMSGYSPTSAADPTRDQDLPEPAEGLPPSAEDGRQLSQADADEHAVRAGPPAETQKSEAKSVNRVDRQLTRRASSSTRTQPQAQQDRKRRSDGDDEDRHDDSQDVDVGGVADRSKGLANSREWDEDTKVMSNGFRLEELR